MARIYIVTSSPVSFSIPLFEIQYLMIDVE